MKPESKVARIKDERTELHPLLDVLLRRLPAVIEVEYRHGTNEMGADFIVEKDDGTFGRREYVGVIAKVGKIAQDFGDLERQIDECGMVRTFRSGTERIAVREIWVITTGNVTANAQEKIHDKFKARKITFILDACLKIWPRGTCLSTDSICRSKPASTSAPSTSTTLHKIFV